MPATLTDPKPTSRAPRVLPSVWWRIVSIGAVVLFLTGPAWADEPSPSDSTWSSDTTGVVAQASSPEAASSVERAWRATLPIETRALDPRRLAAPANLASGVVVAHDDGWATILTSAHGVACVPRCRVIVHFDGGGDDDRGWSRSNAQVAWGDPASDLALLRAPVPRGISPMVLPLPETTATRATQRSVLALGFPAPELLDPSPGGDRVRRGVVGQWVDRPRDFRAGYRASATDQNQGRLDTPSAWLHTAPLVPGASGGPLLDTEGRWLGLHAGSLISSDDGRCVTGSVQPGGPAACLSLSVGLGPAVDALAALLSEVDGPSER